MSDFAYKHKAEFISYLTVLLIPLSYFFSVYLFAGISIAVVIGLIHHFVEKRKHNLFATVLVIFITLTFSVTISFLMLLFYAYVIFPFIGYISISYILFLLSPVIPIFFISFLFIKKELIDRTAVASIKRLLLKSSLYGLLVSLAVFMVLFSVFAVKAVKITNYSYETMEEKIQQIKEMQDIKFSSEIRDLKIIQELNEEQNKLRTKIISKSIVEKPSSFFESFVFFLKGKTHKHIVDSVLFIVDIGLSRNYIADGNEIANKEWEEIQLNKEQGIPFNDSSDDLQSHINFLQSNIVKPYEQFKSKQKEIEQALYQQQPAIIFDVGNLFERANHRIFEHASIIEEFVRLGNEVIKLRYESKNNRTEKLYTSKDVEESPESKAIRLRILEYYLKN